MVNFVADLFGDRAGNLDTVRTLAANKQPWKNLEDSFIHLPIHPTTSRKANYYERLLLSLIPGRNSVFKDTTKCYQTILELGLHRISGILRLPNSMKLKKEMCKMPSLAIF